MKTSVGFDQAIDDIYAAALEPTRWVATTERLATYLEAPSGIAILVDGEGSDAAVIGHTANADAAARHAYSERYFRLDPWAAAYLPLGRRAAFIGDEAVDPRHLAESEFYRDHIRHYGIFHCMGTVVPLGARNALVLAVHRPVTATGFEAADKARLTRLLPHLERAGQVQQVLAMADLQRRAAFAALDRLALAVILLAGDGRIVFANTAADALLRVGEAVTALRGRLTVHDAAAAPALQHAIKSAAMINGGHAADPGVIMQVRRPDKRPLSVLVAPLAASRPVRLLTDAAVIVFITDPDRQRRLPLATLASLYRLTPAEGRLMQALIAGERIEDYADGSGISIATAKTQLRRLFEKTDTSRQSDLISLALRDLVAWLPDGTA